MVEGKRLVACRSLFWYVVGFCLIAAPNQASAGNTFLGTNAGVNPNSPSANTASNNTFIGYYCGTFNTSGENNVFVGNASGNHNSTGASNVFVGATSGNNNTSGKENIFIGGQCAFSNYTGSQNVFLGFGSGYSNNASYNTFIGHKSGFENTSGYYNTYVGTSSGHDNTTGDYNTCVGRSCGYNNINGSGNTLMGYKSGYNASGSHNVFLGYMAGYSEGGSNKLHIANNPISSLIYGDFTNQTVSINGTYTGTTYNLYVYGSGYATGGFSSASDRRLKKKIAPLSGALQKLMKLQGVSYHWRRKKFARLHFPKGKQIGLIAQSVEKVFPQVVKTDKSGYKSISYGSLVSVSVEAIKEQQKIIQKQSQRINKQEQKLARQREMIRSLTQKLAGIQKLQRQMVALERLQKQVAMLKKHINTNAASSKGFCPTK